MYLRQKILQICALNLSQHRRQHEEVCPFKPVQCPEFDCAVTKPMGEIFRHFRLEHHHHFVNAHGSVFNGDIRCDDVNMIMGVERKWAPTMLKLEGGANPPPAPPPVTNGGGADDDQDQVNSSEKKRIVEIIFFQMQDDPSPHHLLGTSPPKPSPSPSPSAFPAQQSHFFLEILRTKHGVWHMWVWYLGEPEEASRFKCEVAIRKKKGGGSSSGGSKSEPDDLELKYSGRVHSIRIPPHRVILSGCLLSFSDYTAGHFRYLGEGHQGHPVIDYRWVHTSKCC